MDALKFKSIDEYHALQPEAVQPVLEEMREAIKAAAPQAQEVISYGMPAFKQNKVLVYYAAWKEHIGFYPTGTGMAAFADRLSGYKSSKGAVQFPLDQPLPLDLIQEMVRYRVQEDEGTKKAKKK